MSGFSTLDEQLNALNALHMSSAKTLDNFADTSKAIADRARRIAADVQPWEIAQENIAATIEEMSRAARCYHPPPNLRLVLSQKEKNPEALCKCIDYLVFTDNYLASHPSNPYADQIAANVTEQLARIVKVAEDTVKEVFISSLQKKQHTTLVNNEIERCETASSLILFNDPSVLEGIDKVIHRLGENFNRTEVVYEDLKQLITERILQLVNSQFDSTYKEDEMQLYHNFASRQNIVSLRKHYQKGNHRLLGISAKTRKLVTEISNYLKRYILEPLDDSFDVVEMPGELAILVFDCIREKCFEIIKVDQSKFSDPTKIFINSRGEGVGLSGETRHFRDVMFIGLDLLEELWKWKSLSETVSGDNHIFVDYVDSEVERFLFEVRDLLDLYVTCVGALDSVLLKEYTRNLHRTEWFPSIDCSAHVLVTNQVYLHKVILTYYFGATKLALHGSLLNSSSESAALLEMEDYMMRCVLGTMRDLEVIAESALEIQLKTTEKLNHHKFPSVNNNHHSIDRNHLISPAIFMLNNILFFIESYRKETCFYQRRIITEEPEDIKKKNYNKEPPSIPIVSNIILMLEDEKVRYVDEFAASWSECFPRTSSDPNLESLNSTNTELNKSQRMAVKHWYKNVAIELNKKIEACKTFTILDTSQRNDLIEASILAVKNEFGVFEAKLRGRAWSKRPIKWMQRSVDQWTELLTKSF